MKWVDKCFTRKIAKNFAGDIYNSNTTKMYHKSAHYF